jgi:electron transfer flavoprotein beta subunit
MLAGLLGFNFVNACIGIEISGTEATTIREIDGGKETATSSLPLIIAGKKGLVEEKDLRIPNMRGIMTARTKALNIVEPTSDANATSSIKFEKPAAKSAVKLINSDNLDELINLLHNEAKVI